MCSLPIVPPATDTHTERAQSKNKPVEIFSLYNQHCVFTTKHPSPAIRPPPNTVCLLTVLEQEHVCPRLNFWFPSKKSVQLW